MENYINHIENVNKAKNNQDLLNAFVEGVRKFGFETVAFHLLTDHREFHLGSKILALTNLLPDIVERYRDRGLYLHDPILRYARSAIRVFEWTEVEQNLTLTDAEKECMDFKRSNGHTNGVYMPLFGVCGNRAGMGLFTTGKTDAYRYDPTVVSAYCNHFYMSYLHLNAHHHATDEKVSLNDKEKDVLILIMAGKTDIEIGQKLGITHHAVNMRMRGIFKKLKTANRIQAAVKAMSLGLISA